MGVVIKRDVDTPHHNNVVSLNGGTMPNISRADSDGKTAFQLKKPRRHDFVPS